MIFLDTKLLPYKIIKKMNKTKDARSGSEIYKRRNSRNYRALIQYKIWERMIKDEIPNVLKEYEKNYAVLISPIEYFGSKENYPNINPYLNKDFILGTTGFIYYTQMSDYNLFEPLKEWRDEEVLELTTKSDLLDKGWNGKVVYNIKNGKPGKISYICRSGNSSDKEKKTLIEGKIIDYWVSEELKYNKKIPDQKGLGNYDYDYANDTTMKNVILQMLYLLLKSKQKSGLDAFDFFQKEYHKEDLNNVCYNPKDNTKFLSNVKNSDYLEKSRFLLKTIENNAQKHNLLDFEKLENLGVWNQQKQAPICPLCKRELYIENFFEGVLQAEGREVLDNTQSFVVLMHVDALAPGKLNHKPYNLGWGHAYCNTLQGDKDIQQTIQELQSIISSYEEWNEKK